MAKKSSYHGFDDAKNIVEAPNIYMDNTQVDLRTDISPSQLIDSQGQDSFVVMSCRGNSYPRDGFVVSMRTNTAEAFQICYSTPYNSVYVSGKNSGNIHPWEKLMVPSDLEKVWKQQVQIFPFTTDKVLPGTAAQAVVQAGAHPYDFCYARTTNSNYSQMSDPIIQNDGSVLVNMIKTKNVSSSNREGCSGVLVIIHVYWKEYTP